MIKMRTDIFFKEKTTVVTNEMLFKTLIRACAHLRREPEQKPDGTGSMTLKARGFGSILDVLTRHDGMTQAEIASMLDMRQQSVSEALEKLEQNGYIRREQSRENRRKALIYVTEEGRAMQKELKDRRDQTAEAFFSCLSDQEKDTLYIILCKLNESGRGR